MSADKRRVLAKEISELPFLRGTTKQEADLATQIRSQILETVFDTFIKPDDANIDVLTTSRWKRARQLWKALVTEKRASYFIDLKGSRYIEWIKTGEATVLPCTTEEVEDRNRTLPGLRGSKSVVNLAKEIRATFLKYSDEFEQRLLQRGVPAEGRRKLEVFRDILRKVREADWFVKKKPKDFVQYERLMSKLVTK